MNTQLRQFLKVLVVLCAMAFSQFGFAAKVVGVKGKKILVNLQGEPAQKGDLFFLINPAGKKRAIIKIMKVKGNKALAVLGKGKARKGYTLQYRPKKSSSAKRNKGGGPDTDAPVSMTTGSSRSSGDMYWGIIAGFAQNSMTVKLKQADTDTNPGADRGEESLSGNGFSFKGLIDYKLLESVWFRGTAGIEQFVAEGGQNCGNNVPDYDNAACETDIMYISLDFWGRYLFSTGSFRPWVGAGFSLLVPMSKSSTALDEASITNTSVMSAGLGFDWFTSDSFYVPVQIEYGLLPSSDDVTANIIAVRVGAGFSF